MLGIKFLFITTLYIASSNAIFWNFGGPGRSEKPETVTAAPAIQQYPISYIRAFAYQPVAFPQPLAPITTYHVSRTPQAYNTKNVQTNGFNAAVLQAMQQQLFKNSRDSNEFPTSSSLVQQLPLNSQVDFGTTPTTTTTTTTTTPAPTQPPTYQHSQPMPQVHVRPEPYQRQISIPQPYQQGNFGGFPQYYSQPQYSQQINPFQFNDQSASMNQFSGRLFNNEPSYQQYPNDPVTYQFIPTSITPLPNKNSNNFNNNVKYVPCMCPVAVSISQPIPEPEKRTDEIPLLSPTPEPERVSFQASTQESEEENKK